MDENRARLLEHATSYKYDLPFVYSARDYQDHFEATERCLHSMYQMCLDSCLTGHQMIAAQSLSIVTNVYHRA